MFTFQSTRQPEHFFQRIPGTFRCKECQRSINDPSHILCQARWLVDPDLCRELGREPRQDEGLDVDENGHYVIAPGQCWDVALPGDVFCELHWLDTK